jgi:virginiamycin B lyase
VALYRTILAVMVSTPLLALAKAPVRAEESARELRVEATVPSYGYSMGVGFGSLWMMSGDKVVRINVGDNSTTDLPIEGARDLFGFTTQRSMAVGEGAIWVPDFDRGVIYKIDPQTNHVVKRIAADMVGHGGSIGAGLGAVWVVTGGSNNELSRFSAESGAEDAKVPLPSRSSAALVAFGSVWITGTGNDELYRVDPTSNEIVATIELDSDPRFLAAGEGSVWVFNEGTGSVQRIDGNDSKLIATIETEAAGKGSTITVGGGFVWVSTRLVPVIQIDPRTNSVRRKFNLVGKAGASTIAYAGGSLWISGSSVRRIKPPE